MAKQDEVTQQAGVQGPGHPPHLGEGVHKTKASSWVTVVLLVLSSLAYGFALPLENLALAILGTVLLVAGVVLGVTGKIMDDAH